MSQRPVPFVVLHHTAGAACTTQAACAQQMRNIQNFHMDTNGWADTGYNFCVGEDGIAYTGRGWVNQGAHAPGFNHRGLGICIFGNFMTRNPNAAAVNAFHALVRCGLANNSIASNYWLVGHRQGSATACPGNSLWTLMHGWPRFNGSIRP